MIEVSLLPYLIVIYLIAAIGWIIQQRKRRSGMEKAALLLSIFGLIFHSILLFLRIKASGHAPFANMFESLLFFCWSIAVVFVVSFNGIKNFPLVGAGLFLFSAVTLGFALTLPLRMKTPQPLMPALRSNWFEFHVITALFSYACLALASAAAVYYLIKGGSLLERLTDNFVKAGFVLLTIAIVTGGFWAHRAWGNYWSWDPKETWALITWGIYFLYFHLKTKYPQQASIVAVFGFISVLFTYLGVNLLISGLHSYK